MAVKYEVVTFSPAGKEHVHEYALDEPVAPGDVVRVHGRDWLVERVEERGEKLPARVFAKPARYRLRLRHSYGHEDVGAFRRFRPDAPTIGHAFTTVEDGLPVSWQVVDERLTHDEQGAPYLDLLAERDYAELEDLPDHELEHLLAARDSTLPSDAAAALARAAEAGLAVELAALEVGSFEDEADPESGHGWMCRLADSGTLTVARFHRVRKAELQV